MWICGIFRRGLCQFLRQGSCPLVLVPQCAQGTTLLRYAVAFKHWEKITLFLAVMTLVSVDPQKLA
jgi:hypothetical protein